MDTLQNLRDKVKELPEERRLDFMEMLIANLWTLQNNWMVRVEERFGHEVATEFDTLCYGRMSEVAVYRLKKFFNLGDDMRALLTCLDYLVPEPGSEGQWIQASDRKAILRVTKCAMQLARKERGAPELPCKPALIGVMEKTFKAINPKFRVVRALAPPDPHPEDLWCELEVELEDSD